MTDEELDTRIREMCDARGRRFKPWQIHPADAHDGPSPYPKGKAGHVSWPKAQRLRRLLIAEMEAKDKPRG